MFPPCFDPKWDTDHLPKQPCPGGIRSNIIFPLFVSNQLKLTEKKAQTDGRVGAGTERTLTAQIIEIMFRTRLVGHHLSRLSMPLAQLAIL